MVKASVHALELPTVAANDSEQDHLDAGTVLSSPSCRPARVRADQTHDEKRQIRRTWKEERCNPVMRRHR